jgi:hypothetical protein
VSVSTKNEGTKHALFVIPNARRDGFQASVRGHIFDLIDPSSYGLAPTADDLFIVSIASTLAWSARGFLRSHGLPDYVSVSAEWWAKDVRQHPADISLTVTVSEATDEVSMSLAAELENCLAARSLAKPVVHISLEGVDQ